MHLFLAKLSLNQFLSNLEAYGVVKLKDLV
jgi:hypothetical protein